MFYNLGLKSRQAILKAVFGRELPGPFLKPPLIRSGRGKGAQEHLPIGGNELREMPLQRPEIGHPAIGWPVAEEGKPSDEDKACTVIPGFSHHLIEGLL